MAEEPKHPVRTTKKSIRILETLKERKGCGVTEIAEVLDINKGTAHNHLRTLLAEELVVQEQNQYHLSLRFLDFASYTRNRSHLLNVAKSELERLAEQSGEFANLGVEEFGRCIYLGCEKGDQAVDLTFRPGMRRPMHLTALGKAILSTYSRDRVDSIVDRHGLNGKTSKSITSHKELDEQLGEIKKRGYALDDEEYIPGLRCIAVPIQSTGERALGSIGIAIPKSRCDDDQFFEELPNLVLSVSNIIELNINHS